jgi:hypothetical protein
MRTVQPAGTPARDWSAARFAWANRSPALLGRAAKRSDVAKVDVTGTSRGRLKPTE